MAAAFDKQHASRENVDQVLAYLGGGATVASNKFGTATQQIRVVSEIQGWLSIGYSTTGTVGTNGAPRILFLEPISGINTYEPQSR